MKQYLETAKKYIIQRNELFIGIGIVAGTIVIAIAVTLIIKASGPHIVYEPVKACDLFTPAEAQDLMAKEKVIGVDSKEPVIANDLATSKCSYTDSNPDQNQMIVAAVAIRAGINDKGVEQNKADFAKGKPKQGVEDVKNLGSSAYFNLRNGQLNVLDGHAWIIISYGIGASPELNSVEKAVELAHKVLPKSPTTRSS